MGENGDRFGIYLRQTTRHKWRLTSILLNPDTAAGHKEALITQARSEGRTQTEGRVVAYGLGEIIQETL